MDKCAIEVFEESKLKMEADKGSDQKLGKHLGKLLFVLELFGIPVIEGRKCNRFLDLLQKFCYPIFIHLSLLYLWYDTLSSGELSYGSVIDTVLPMLPCIMWILMRRQVASLKMLFADLSKITSKNFMSRNRCLSISTNAALGFIFLYPLLLISMRLLQGNDVTVKEVFRIIQEAIFPVTFAIVYISISYLLLQKMRFCKKMFDNSSAPGSTDVDNAARDYLDVINSVEAFENLFCNVAIVLVLQDFLISIILVIDVLYDGETFMKKILFEALSEWIYVLVSLGIASFGAANISLEMAAIKSVLVEKMFNSSDQDDPKDNQKRIELLLKKDICVLTAGKALVFDRGFILKALVFIFATVVFICQIKSLSG